MCAPHRVAAATPSLLDPVGTGSVADWTAFRQRLRSAIAQGQLTRSELAQTLGRSSLYRHLGTFVVDANDTLLKPLSSPEDMGLGPAGARSLGDGARHRRRSRRAALEQQAVALGQRLDRPLEVVIRID